MIKFKRLPKEYQEVEYIESTSYVHNTNYINTGIFPTNNTSIELYIEISSDKSHLWDRFYGSSELFRNESQSTTIDTQHFHWNKRIYDHMSFPINKPVKIKQNKNKFYLDDILLHTFSEATFQDTNVLRLFSVTTGDRDGIFKLYYCKIWEDDVLVRNYIPCYRKSDNEIGLYDLVNNVFYTNQGTGTFLKGNDILTDIKQIKTKVNNEIKDIGYIKTFRLPKEYQEIEYIESTGTQYIDTGFKPNQDTKVITNMITSESEGTVGFFFGCDNGWLNTGFGVVRNNSEYGFSTQTHTNEKNVFKKIEFGKIFKINNLLIREFTEQTFQSLYNLTIFALIRSGNLIEFGHKKLYTFKIYDNETLVRNYIPCYRKSNNEIGLYDLVSKTFFTNAGTGTFLKGNKISNKVFDRLPIEYQRVSYLESTGTQYIDSGVYPYKTTVIYKAANTIFSSADSRFFSCYSTVAPQRFYAILKTANNIWRAHSNVVADFETADDKPHEFIFNDSENKCYIDGVLKAKNSGFDLPSQMNVTAGIMANHSANGWDYSGNTKRLWYMKVIDKNTNTMIRDFIPCYRKLDNKPGLYDMVTKEFYTNAGTGEFLVGDDI